MLVFEPFKAASNLVALKVIMVTLFNLVTLVNL